MTNDTDTLTLTNAIKTILDFDPMPIGPMELELSAREILDTIPTAFFDGSFDDIANMVHYKATMLLEPCQSLTMYDVDASLRKLAAYVLLRKGLTASEDEALVAYSALRFNRWAKVAIDKRISWHEVEILREREIADSLKTENYNVADLGLLSRMDVTPNEQSFVYLGFTFTPHRSFRAEESKRAIRSCATGGINLNKAIGWSIVTFYSASSSDEADIFVCNNDGNMYVPYDNGMFLWLGEE